jgi:EmrB/QacA subfamily drug resistance transporter
MSIAGGRGEAAVGKAAHRKPAAPAPEAEAGYAPGTVMALAAMGLGVFVIANDFTALNVGLPAIESDFDVDVGTSQWVVNAYALVFGLAIVTGGRLADMFGRRRIFFIGAGMFAGFSALGGLAPEIGWLIAARVGMGIGGALMWPAILGMTYAALPPAKAGLAGGLILGVAGIGNAAGPLIGGALTELISWRMILFINVPIAAFAVLVTLAKVHQRESPQREAIDYPGIVALSLSLLLLLLSLDQASDWGFGDPRIIAMLAASAALIALFTIIEPRRGSGALVPIEVIRNRPFAAACLSVLLMSAVFFTTVLYVPQFLIKILGYSALEAGLGLLPMMVVFALTSFIAGSLYGRFGAKPVVSAGAVLIVAGTFAISKIDDGSTYGSLLPGLILIGLGVGLFYSSVTTAAVTALPDSQSSLAGGLVYMFQIAGGAIGLGAATAIFTRASENELAEQAADAGTRLSDHQGSVLHGLLAGTDSATAALAQLGSSVRSEIEQIVRDSFASGIATSFRAIAVVSILGLIVAVLGVGGPLRRGHRPGQAAPEGEEGA